jgi:hypothetical protein
MLINRERHLSHENLERQADKMVARSNQVLQPVTVGNNVTLPVPSVDRGRGDPKDLHSCSNSSRVGIQFRREFRQLLDFQL